MSTTELPGIETDEQTTTRSTGTRTTDGTTDRTTDITTSQSTSDTSSETSTSSSRGLPTLTSSVSSFSTPTVRIPANADNPYIYRSSQPSGTVFICFGAILGTILLSYLGFLVWRSYTSKKDTAENYNDANTGYYGSDPGEATGSSSRLPLLKPKNSSLSQFSMIRPNSPQPMQQMKQNDVTRLQFVSPTFEAMNMSKQNENRPQISEPTMLSTSNLSVSNATHNRNSSYLSMPLHQRDSSYMPALGSTSEISLAAPRKSTAPATRQTRTGHRTVPSMYLESMFDDSRDD